MRDERPASLLTEPLIVRLAHELRVDLEAVRLQAKALVAVFIVEGEGIAWGKQAAERLAMNLETLDRLRHALGWLDGCRQVDLKQPCRQAEGLLVHEFVGQDQAIEVTPVGASDRRSGQVLCQQGTSCLVFIPKRLTDLIKTPERGGPAVVMGENGRVVEAIQIGLRCRERAFDRACGLDSLSPQRIARQPILTEPKHVAKLPQRRIDLRPERHPQVLLTQLTFKIRKDRQGFLPTVA